MEKQQAKSNGGNTSHRTMEVSPLGDKAGIILATKTEPVWERDNISRQEETRNGTLNPDQLQLEKTFEDIETYFTKDAWEELQDWEKEVYRDIKEHYDVIISFGYDVPKPDFMSVVEEAHQLVCESRRRIKGGSAALPEDSLFRYTNQTLPRTASKAHPIGRNVIVEQKQRAHKHHDRNRLHTEEKPYVCTECRKCFKWPNHLHRHQRVHTGERPYKCGKCGKSFSRSDNFDRHQQVHREGTLFQCRVCGEFFSQLETLKAHTQIHIRETI
nr:PREDICTED: zinc finger protein 30-like [Latimeria chalumnae]|eukprot:XP_014348851.1 PREDICTED: zinc finger protein 30-like [Latimeria chalumnae]